MPNEKLTNYNDPDAIAGVIVKAASVGSLEVTDAELKEINKYTLSEVAKEDVFVFKATLADNEQDDRNFMPFNMKALEDMKALYIGKTMLKDHERKADNQVGRVFATELVVDASRTTALGEPHAELMAKVYMLKTAGNADLIAEINGGIKKEVSTSCSPEKLVCSICGKDNMKDYCKHWPGVKYEVKDGEKTCLMLIDGAKEVYEFSLVAVPAQPRAGAHKSVGFVKPVAAPEEPEETKEAVEPTEITENKDLELALEAQLSESFYFTSHYQNV